MAIDLDTYEGLKAAIASYLNKKNLTDQIPVFIDLAENSIFRRLRCPANEMLAEYEDADENVTLPENLLEIKMVSWDGKPLERKSETQIKALLAGGEVGTPACFGRVMSRLYFYPSPDAVADLSLYYWADLSDDIKTNDDSLVFQFCPDLYLFGALVEGYTYLMDEERAGFWQQRFLAAFDAIDNQAKADELSGSTLETVSTYG